MQKIDFNKIIVACGTLVQRYVTPEQIRQIFDGQDPSKNAKKYPYKSLNTTWKAALTRNGEVGNWFIKLFDYDMKNSLHKALNELPPREIHKVINSPVITDGNLIVPEAYVYEPVEGLAELITKHLDDFFPDDDASCSLEARINALLLLKAASLDYYSDGNIIVKAPQIGLVDFEESTLRSPEDEPIRDGVQGYKLLKEKLGPEEITVEMLLNRCNESLEILNNKDVKDVLQKHLEVAMKIDEGEANLIIRNTIRAIEKFRDDLRNGTAF